MKYLGKIVDDKDLVTKEYVDTAVVSSSSTLTFSIDSVDDKQLNILFSGSGGSSSKVLLTSIPFSFDSSTSEEVVESCSIASAPAGSTISIETTNIGGIDTFTKGGASYSGQQHWLTGVAYYSVSYTSGSSNVDIILFSNFAGDYDTINIYYIP